MRAHAAYANGRALRPYRRLVIVRDDRFFYPSRGPLDATSSVGFFGVPPRAAAARRLLGRAGGAPPGEVPIAAPSREKKPR